MSHEKAVNALKEAFKNDPDYAWVWQCNLAMSAYDEGLPKPKANLAAARFMRLAFGIDMTKHEHFAGTQEV